MQGQTSSYVITALMSPPTSTNLTTLEHVKDDLDIADSSNDARLSRYVAEESANIARHCNRVFGLATWQDEFRPQRGVWGEGVRSANNPLKLTKWPVATGAIEFSGNTHANKLIDGIASTAGLVIGMPVFGDSIPVGATIAAVMPYGILLSLAATATVSSASLVAGLSITEMVAGNSKTLIPLTDFEVDAGSLLPGDEGASTVYRLNELGNPKTWPPARITVIYQAGYVLPGQDVDCSATGAKTLPADLESACIRIVVGRYLARGRDPMQRSREQPGIGRDEWWVGAVPGQTGPYPNEIMAILDRYRVPVVA